MVISLRARLKGWVPPKLVYLVRRLRDVLVYAEWEFVEEGWEYTSEKVKGWDVKEIVRLQEAKWPSFVKALSSTRQMGINHEAISYSEPDLFAHNLIMTYSYVLALAAHKRDRISILDWGGGIGHYGKFSEAALPIEISYTCYDLEIFCEAGRSLYREATFESDPSKIYGSHFDTTIIGSSLWYDRNWQKTLNELVKITDEYLFIARMIFVENVGSYIAIQRPYSAGYPTEYLCQIFNQDELIDYLGSCNFELYREFFVGDGTHIHRAPEQGVFKSFLFRKKD